MPLKLTNLQNPSSTNIINRWADEKDQTLDTHSAQIQMLIVRIAALEKLKNPT